MSRKWNKKLTPSKSQNDMVSKMTGSGGKFFTITTTDYVSRCVQYRGDTRYYIWVFDRNAGNGAGRLRKIAKNRIFSIYGEAVTDYDVTLSITL